MSLASINQKLQQRSDLSTEEMQSAMRDIMSGNAEHDEIKTFLLALKAKGEIVDEIASAASVLREYMTPLSAPDGAIDTCGTGGDGQHTLNISTATAIVLAACGLPVAKHGNRSVSSKSGSADVLENLGLNLNAPKEMLEEALAIHHFCFMMAPNFHPTMKQVAKVRAEIGERTIFNLLGPLINPATPDFQLLGVYKPGLLEPFAHVLKKFGLKHAWVVHGHDGLDEISITGPTKVAELKDGEITMFEITPEEAGLKRASLADIQGGEPIANAQALTELLDGKPSAYRDMVTLNAGAASLIAGKVETLAEGVQTTSNALDSKAAQESFSKIIRHSRLENGHANEDLR
jgi:anthranilate phosphoribosyltransferase